MTYTATSGPLITFGQAATPPGGVTTGYNPHAGPSVFFQGTGIIDPRPVFTFQPGGALSATRAWLGTNRIPVLDVVPATAATQAIAANANVTANTAMTLVSSDGAGIVVGKSVVNAATGATVTGLLAVGAAMGTVSFGQSGGIAFWDPTKALARAVAITAAAGASGTVVFTIKGFDVYGYPMTEQITAATAAQTAGKKAWKYIQSVTPSATDAHNYSVDLLDVYGLMLRADSYAYLDVFFGNPASPANNVITAATGFVAADTTSPATATTGDVRGTITATSDGTKRLTVFASPSLANIGTTTGLLGVTQV